MSRLGDMFDKEATSIAGWRDIDDGGERLDAFISLAIGYVDELRDDRDAYKLACEVFSLEEVACTCICHNQEANDD